MSGGDAIPYGATIEQTTAALAERVRSGEMRYVRGDVPLEDMLALAESDLKYTIVSFLECGACGTTWFWGLCIRGAPILKIVEASAPESWRWESVPPRQLWM